MAYLSPFLQLYRLPKMKVNSLNTLKLKYIPFFFYSVKLLISILGAYVSVHYLICCGYFQSLIPVRVLCCLTRTCTRVLVIGCKSPCSLKRFEFVVMIPFECFYLTYFFQVIFWCCHHHHLI